MRLQRAPGLAAGRRQSVVVLAAATRRARAARNAAAAASNLYLAAPSTTPAAPASSSAASWSSLAQYAWPDTRIGPAAAPPAPGGMPGPARWFEAAVQRIVRHADGQPFLQLVHAQPLVHTQQIDLTAEEAAAGWGALQRRLAGAAADAIILVQPVPEAGVQLSSSCAATGVDAAVAVAAACALPAAGESACGGVPVADVMAGQVGDCCSDSDSPSSSDSGSSAPGAAAHHSSSSSSSRSNSSRAGQEPADAAAGVGPRAAPTSSASASASSAHTSYYGLVVQAAQHSQVQGCYLLKAVRTTHAEPSGGGCHCTHYTLTRVCQGQPLAQQLMRSWLI